MALAIQPAVSADALYRLLDRFIDKSRCILCYDQDLIDQLPDILIEQHRIRTDRDVMRCQDLVSLFDLLDPTHAANYQTDQLPDLIRASEVDLSRYITVGDVLAEDREDFKAYSDAKSDADLEEVLRLQADIGQNLQKGEEGRVKPHLLDPEQLHLYLTWVTTVPAGRWEKFFKCDFWSLQVKKWALLRQLDKTAPSLSVGPRWLSEILYFRETLGLTQHIGLDLHSEDESLVTKGDMHSMPFGDNHFGLVFIKNTIDKSYDVRRLISELVRVSRHGGIVAVDGNCFHGHATMLHRSDIQTAENLLTLFKARTRLKVLTCKTIDISGMGDAAATNAKRNNVRLAVRILKK